MHMHAFVPLRTCVWGLGIYQRALIYKYMNTNPDPNKPAQATLKAAAKGSVMQKGPVKDIKFVISCKIESHSWHADACGAPLTLR